MSTRIRHLALPLALATAALLTTHTATADTLAYNGLFYSSPDTVHITYGSPTVTEYVYSGGLKMTDTTGPWTMGAVTTPTNASFAAWCMDIYDNVAASANYTLYTAQAYPAWSHVPVNATRIAALERLASNDLNLVNNATTSSAFQLAAWEIMAENSANYNLSSGNFSASEYQSAAGTLAQTWLNSLGSATPTMQLYVWKANVQGASQDLAVFAPVPEPGTYAMLLAGLGVMGFIARRRVKLA